MCVGHSQGHTCSGTTASYFTLITILPFTQLVFFIVRPPILYSKYTQALIQAVLQLPGIKRGFGEFPSSPKPRKFKHHFPREVSLDPSPRLIPLWVLSQQIHLAPRTPAVTCVMLIFLNNCKVCKGQNNTSPNYFRILQIYPVWPVPEIWYVCRNLSWK